MVSFNSPPFALARSMLEHGELQQAVASAEEYVAIASRLGWDRDYRRSIGQRLAAEIGRAHV